MWRDDAYLLDILLSARKLLKFTEGFEWESFRKNELVQSAAIRQLEIIGEASARISQEFKVSHHNLPWKEMTGMRNSLIHEYFRVDLAEVWSTIEFDIPELITALELLVPPDKEAD